METLEEPEPHFAARCGGFRALYSLGERHRSEVQDEFDEVGDHPPLAFAGEVNVADEANVELDEMRWCLAQFVQSRLSGAEVIIGEAHADVLQAGGQFDELPDFGHGAFVDLDDQVQPGKALASLPQRGKERGVEGLLGMDVGEEGETVQARRQHRQCEAAERLAEFGFLTQRAGDPEQRHRCTRQLRVAGTAEKLVGDDRPAGGIGDGLHGTAEALPSQQLVKLAFVDKEVLGQHRTRRCQHRHRLVEARQCDRAQANAELGATKVQDVVLLQQAGALEALSIDRRTVRAVEVGQLETTAEVFGEHRVVPTEVADRGNQVVVEIATDAEWQLTDVVGDARAVGADRLEEPGRAHRQLPGPASATSSARAGYRRGGGLAPLSEVHDDAPDGQLRAPLPGHANPGGVIEMRRRAGIRLSSQFALRAKSSRLPSPLTSPSLEVNSEGSALLCR
ncbi:MAG: hypothetical protein AW07_03268 [Candidatus Accumulibacter sp. SK-11]|nr:MAG: hypothetical protein AW07_03268 [Candidatus Accumulibacter sp. SK-11]